MFSSKHEWENIEWSRSFTQPTRSIDSRIFKGNEEKRILNEPNLHRKDLLGHVEIHFPNVIPKNVELVEHIVNIYTLQYSISHLSNVRTCQSVVQTMKHVWYYPGLHFVVNGISEYGESGG